MATPNELPDYVLRNRAVWDEWAPNWVAAGERNWAAAEPSSGMWDDGPVARPRMGASLAQRRGLEGAQARLKLPALPLDRAATPA